MFLDEMTNFVRRLVHDHFTQETLLLKAVQFVALDGLCKNSVVRFADGNLAIGCDLVPAESVGYSVICVSWIAPERVASETIVTDFREQ